MKSQCMYFYYFNHGGPASNVFFTPIKKLTNTFLQLLFYDMPGPNGSKVAL